VRNDVRLESLTYDSSKYPATFAQHFIDRVLTPVFFLVEFGLLRFKIKKTVDLGNKVSEIDRFVFEF